MATVDPVNPSQTTTPPPPPPQILAQAPTVTAAKPVAPPRDPAVAAQVDEAHRRMNFGPEPSGALTFQIERVMNDPKMSRAQKQDFVASLVEMSSGKTTPYGGASERERQAIVRSLAEIGTAYTTTDGLRNQVGGMIASATNSGRLDASDLRGLFVQETNGKISPNSNFQGTGVRSLLTGINDGKVLGSLSEMLARDAQKSGFNINDYNQHGVSLLVAASDVANMAARNGSPAAANMVVGIIDAQTAKGPVAGDMSLVDAMISRGMYSGMMQTTQPGRTGLDVVSRLLSSATPSEKTDSLFASLVRANGLSSRATALTDPSYALQHIGSYFNNNAQRLIQNDWQRTNTGQSYEDLTRDFIQNIAYNKEYNSAGQTATVIANEMKRLSGIIQNPGYTESQRIAAANSLGTITGSIKSATNRFVEAAGSRAKDETAIPAYFAEQLFSKLVDKVPGPAGQLASQGGDAIIEAMTAAYVNRAKAQATATTGQLTGDLTNLGQAARLAFSRLPNADGVMNHVMSQFDQRFDKAID